MWIGVTLAILTCVGWWLHSHFLLRRLRIAKESIEFGELKIQCCVKNWGAAEKALETAQAAKKRAEDARDGWKAKCERSRKLRKQDMEALDGLRSCMRTLLEQDAPALAALGAAPPGALTALEPAAEARHQGEWHDLRDGMLGLLGMTPADAPPANVLKRETDDNYERLAEKLGLKGAVPEAVVRTEQGRDGE